jgi:1-acyl-sn-glycerol-3-phosphate acyltransferase
VRMAAPTITLETRSSTVDPAGDGAPADDPFGLDAAFRERMLPPVRFLFERYWRVEVSGLHHLPTDGPVLVVSNHSGAIPFDGMMIVTAVELFCRRTLRFLYDRFVEQLAPVASFYNKCGGAVATRENAVRLLQLGEPLLIFPEGVAGVAKSFGDRYRLRPFSPGFARLALALDVPIVPVAVVGAEEAAPIFAHVPALQRLTGLIYFPVTPTFPHFGLLGMLGYLPAKFRIRFLPPVATDNMGDEPWQDKALVQTVADEVRDTIQRHVLDMLAKRTSVWL